MGLGQPGKFAPPIGTLLEWRWVKKRPESSGKTVYSVSIKSMDTIQ